MKCSFAAVSVTYVLLLACGDDPTSPDDGPGRLLLYRQPGGNLAEIWSMRPDGSDARQLTSDNRIDADADWSPDGRRIVFTKLNDTTTRSRVTRTSRFTSWTRTGQTSEG